MDRVIYSSVEIELLEAFLPQEDPADSLSYGERLGGTLSDSLGVLVSYLQGFLIVIITVLPVLLLIAFLVTATVLLIRFVKKRMQKWNEAKGIENVRKSDKEEE